MKPFFLSSEFNTFREFHSKNVNFHLCGIHFQKEQGLYHVISKEYIVPFGSVI